MKRTHLPLNGLRVLDAAARHLSFTRAADELAVTPAAVGQQIRALEDMLGVVLFRRTPKGLELTPETEGALEALRGGFLMFEEAVHAMQAGQSSMTLQPIEVLEGLEPVRHSSPYTAVPGMYIGGTDERALHHLAAEVLDNSMDEAWLATPTGSSSSGRGQPVTITDNGRGIPVDPHPKFPGKSALEVILTTLHSGGKFSTRPIPPQAVCTASAFRW
jgi:hypothetical protein